MRYILTRLRRGRRRNRIPHGLLVSAAAAMLLVLTLTLSASLFAIPASARNGIRMPRTEDGVVTDGDGIIDSNGVAGDVPDVTDMLPGDGMTDGGNGTGGGTNEGSDALDPTVSGTGNGTDTGVTDPAGTGGTTDAGTTDGTTTTDRQTTDAGTTDMVDDVADATGISPWVIGLILLAIIVAIVILVVWWATGARRR